MHISEYCCENNNKEHIPKLVQSVTNGRDKRNKSIVVIFNKPQQHMTINIKSSHKQDAELGCFLVYLRIRTNGDKPMITVYYRPENISEALDLLKQPDTLPLGGGTLLSTLKNASVKAVDLQALGLNTLTHKGNHLEIGSTVTLQQLIEHPDTPDTLKIAIKLEAPLNIRNAATIAGTLMAADGRSTFAAAILALDAKLTIQPDDETMEIGNFLPLRPGNTTGKLITSISLPINTKFAFETVARTPSDKPIVCAAVAVWPSGRTRLALGGYGKSPLLAMDGTENEGLETAARNAYHEAADDWASAEYRMDIATILAQRCFGHIK